MSATVKSDPPRLSLRTRLLRWVVQRLRTSGEAGTAPHRALLLLLSLAWGNLWYAASLSYLRHVGRRAAASPGPFGVAAQRLGQAWRRGNRLKES